MAARISLALAIHNHQPVGNFNGGVNVYLFDRLEGDVAKQNVLVNHIPQEPNETPSPIFNPGTGLFTNSLTGVVTPLDTADIKISGDVGFFPA